MADCRITCIVKSNSLSGLPQHEHITHVGNQSTTPPWLWTVEQVINSIDSKSNTFYVMDARGNRAEVGVVRPTYGRPHLRTYANGVWTDNLLSLPTCY